MIGREEAVATSVPDEVHIQVLVPRLGGKGVHGTPPVIYPGAGVATRPDTGVKADGLKVSGQNRRLTVRRPDQELI